MKRITISKDILVGILKISFSKIPFFIRGGNPVAQQLLAQEIHRNGINSNNYYAYENHKDCSLIIEGEEIEKK